MMDNLTIKAVEETYNAGLPKDAAAVLIIELDGLKDGMERLTERVQEICRKNNVREIRVAKDQAERDVIWGSPQGAFGAVEAASQLPGQRRHAGPDANCRKRWPGSSPSARNTTCPSPMCSTRGRQSASPDPF